MRTPGLLLFSSLLAAAPAAQSRIIGDVHGKAANDRFGTAVAGVGDVDGDGRGDFMVGAPFEDATGTDAGSARVYSGRTRAVLWQFFGGAAGDRLGAAVAGAGDVDADGTPDVVVGAPNAMGRGTATVYSGRTGLLLHRWTGDAAGDELGFSVNSADDVDGDGFGDVIVGAHLANTTATDAGLARVYSGRTGGTLFTFVGDGYEDHCGTSVCSAGDVDGDGVPDLLIGVPWDDNFMSKAGTARVHSGADGRELVELDGHGFGHEFGWSVARLGDLDGDGRAELLIGEPEHKLNGNDSGAVWVYDGKTLQPRYTWYGTGGFEYFGLTIAGGDVDADGVPDIVIGAPRDDVFKPDAGAIYAYSGATGQQVFVARGTTYTGVLGWSVGVVADADGNGIADMIAGVPQDDPAGTDSGSARLFCGAPTPSLRTFGAGCSANGPPALSYAGTARFGQTVQIMLGGAPAAAPAAVVLFGFSAGAPYPLDLTALGMTGCRLYHAPDIAVDLPLQGGAGTMPVSLAGAPGLCGLVIFNQALVLDAGANPFGVALSNAGRIDVAY